MGFSTTFLGRLDIEPPLNPSEVKWLTAYAELDRRHFTDPYELPKDPRAFCLEQARKREEERERPTSGTKAPTQVGRE